MSYGFRQVEMDRVYGFCHYVMRVIFDIAFRGEVIGLDNLPKSGAYIVASNHASHLDPSIVGGNLPRQVSFFARKTLWKPGFASWWLNTVGTIPVDRDGGSDVTAIKRVLQTLKSNKVIILFPEGTRSTDGNLQPPKPGVGLLACRTRVPVVPARIYRSFDAYGREGKLRLGTPVTVIYGKPISPDEYDDPAAGKERYQRASECIMRHIAALHEPAPVVL